MCVCVSYSCKGRQNRVDVLAQWQPPLTHTATVLCEVDGGAEPAEGPNRVDFALRPDAGLCVHDGASW